MPLLPLLHMMHLSLPCDADMYCSTLSFLIAVILQHYYPPHKSAHSSCSYAQSTTSHRTHPCHDILLREHAYILSHMPPRRHYPTPIEPCTGTGVGCQVLLLTLTFACRYYVAPDQFASLMQTVTIQLIIAVRAYINAPGKLWDQDKPQLIAHLCAVARLRDVFVGSFRCTLSPPSISAFSDMHVCRQGK